jgi:hypothetical protein
MTDYRDGLKLSIDICSQFCNAYYPLDDTPVEA